MKRLLAPIVVVLAVITACETYPQAGQTYIVILTELQIGSEDFNLSTLGNPLGITISIKINGRTLATTGTQGGNLSGRRGERVLKKPIQWIIKYDKGSTYQIVIEEQSIIAGRFRYQLPGTPKLGDWPFSSKSTNRSLGKNSYLHFEVLTVE